MKANQRPLSSNCSQSETIQFSICNSAFYHCNYAQGALARIGHPASLNAGVLIGCRSGTRVHLPRGPSLSQSGTLQASSKKITPGLRGRREWELLSQSLPQPIMSTQSYFLSQSWALNNIASANQRLKTPCCSPPGLHGQPSSNRFCCRHGRFGALTQSRYGETPAILGWIRYSCRPHCLLSHHDARYRRGYNNHALLLPAGCCPEHGQWSILDCRLTLRRLTHLY